MTSKSEKLNIVVGQGLAGSAVAWQLHWSGAPVLLIDSGKRNSASRVAAGLITPITGKRLVTSDNYASHWAVAKAFYRRVEELTGTQFFFEGPMLRLFSSDRARRDFLDGSGRDADVLCRECVLQEAGVSFPAIEIAPAGRLNVISYLTATRKFFESAGCFAQKALSLDDTEKLLSEIEPLHHAYGDYRLIMATGACSSTLFPDVPNNPAHGEVLSVDIPNYRQESVVHRSIWIAPEAGNRCTVGSTYDWNRSDGEPSQTGRDELLDRLGQLVSGQIDVAGHLAGVRPTMKDYQAVIGEHADQAGTYVVNGLGSKGALKAPSLAAEFVSFLGGQPIQTSHRLERLIPMTHGSRTRPLTAIAQQQVSAILHPGDTAIDATVGNGFDTEFLARTVTSTGSVFGFDIQKSALASTEQRLKARNHANVTLWNKSHAMIQEQASPQSVTAIMFNLGYLPRSDHSIITTPESTLPAIRGGIEILKPGGVMTILCYRGHAGGPEEYEQVEQLLTQETSGYDLETFLSSPAKPTSPVLFVVRKHKDS